MQHGKVLHAVDVEDAIPTNVIPSNLKSVVDLREESNVEAKVESNLESEVDSNVVTNVETKMEAKIESKVDAVESKVDSSTESKTSDLNDLSVSATRVIKWDVPIP